MLLWLFSSRHLANNALVCFLHSLANHYHVKVLDFLTFLYTRLSVNVIIQFSAKQKSSPISNQWILSPLIRLYKRKESSLPLIDFNKVSDSISEEYSDEANNSDNDIPKLPNINIGAEESDNLDPWGDIVLDNEKEKEKERAEIESAKWFKNEYLKVRIAAKDDLELRRAVIANKLSDDSNKANEVTDHKEIKAFFSEKKRKGCWNELPVCKFLYILIKQVAAPN